MVRASLLLSLFLVAACSKGPQADLPSISEARSLGAEWALVNQQAGEGKLTDAYVSAMHGWLREQLETASTSLTEPSSAYAAEVHALLGLPDEAAPEQIRGHVARLKQIEDQLESA